MFNRFVFSAAFTAAITVPFTATLGAEAAIPKSDKPGSKDSPLLQRYHGSFIVAYEYKAFDEFVLPLSKIEQIPGRKDRLTNYVYEPKKKLAVEGPYTRLVYLIPEGRSPLEVLRNYQDEIRRGGGKVLFECKAAECGGDPLRSSHLRYGGLMHPSLSIYLYPEERVKDKEWSDGSCALKSQIVDQRYMTAELRGAHVSALTYTLTPQDRGTGDCQRFMDRTIAVIDIIEGKAREEKMVTVQAGEMSMAIAGTGRVTLYGIYFDFNKADIRPESDPTLEQIGKLLKDTPVLKLLVVGHTDNIGSFASNTDLSQHRAVAVVNALATRFGIGRDRLIAAGVSFASPVASNRSEEGRARNRRVELVER
jgi:OmpA-OmpF porin, OOP family